MLFRWLRKLFETPHDVHPCGCIYWHPTFTPISVDRCAACQIEWDEWWKKNPPKPKCKCNDDTSNYFF